MFRGYRIYLVNEILSEQSMFRLTTLLAAYWTLIALNGAFAANVDFEKQIQPIFLEHCAGCHGEKKKLGKMRLHTPAEIQNKIAADEQLLIAGKPQESELYQRLVLPAVHKKRMPKKADPLAKEKIELIRLWIEQGVSFPAATVAKKAPREKLSLPEVPPADDGAIEQLQATGSQVIHLFANNPLLQVSFALRDSPTGDAEVAHLSAVAEQVYALNLAGSQVSNEGLAVLTNLKNLGRLHLENSTVTDAGLSHIAKLERLEYLNLYGTGITDAGIAQLKGLKHLENLYLWKTKVSYDAAMELEKQIPGLKVDLGYDHPVIARMRLTKQMERAQAQVKDAAASALEAKQKWEQAKQNADAARKRRAEIQKELKALDGDSKPAEEAEPEQPKEGDKAA